MTGRIIGHLREEQPQRASEISDRRPQFVESPRTGVGVCDPRIQAHTHPAHFLPGIHKQQTRVKISLNFIHPSPHKSEACSPQPELVLTGKQKNWSTHTGSGVPPPAHTCTHTHLTHTHAHTQDSYYCFGDTSQLLFQSPFGRHFGLKPSISLCSISNLHRVRSKRKALCFSCTFSAHRVSTPPRSIFAGIGPR